MQVLVRKRILSIQQTCNFFSYFSALLLTLRMKWEKKNHSISSTKPNFAITSSPRASANMVTGANTSTKTPSRTKIVKKPEATVNNLTAQKAQWNKYQESFQPVKHISHRDTKTCTICWLRQIPKFLRCNFIINVSVMGTESRIRKILEV